MEGAGGSARDADTPTLIMSAGRRWAVTAGVMTGMFLAALALLVSFYLPRSGGGGDGASAPPTEAECDAATGERLVMAELTNIDPEHEPAASRGD